MLRTVEAMIDEQGQVRLSESITLTRPSRALLTILDISAVDDATLLSEPALADWNRPEEVEAWACFQSPPSF